MPSYDDQLAAYRSQLANLASNQAAGSVPGTGPMTTAGLAFNTMMSDMARAAAFVRSTPAVPMSASIPAYPGQAYQMGLGEAAWAVFGPGHPSSPMYMEDYQHFASARMSQFAGNAVLGMATGVPAMAAGVGAGALTGAAIGTAVFPGFGTIAGAVVGAGVSYAVGKVLADAQDIRGIAGTIQSVTPMVTGGVGMSASAAREISRFSYRNALATSQSPLAAPDTDLVNLALNQGSRYGLFMGQSDPNDFKRELGEMTKTIREVSNALRMAREEVVPLLAEMRQGGFYGSASAQRGILAGSGLAYGAGVSYESMHEAGLRGAAMFRGTGVPVHLGYEMGQTGLFQARRMQQMGMIGPETVNQLGGTSGVANMLTGSAGAFTQGMLGRATAAMLMQGAGGVNQGALAAIMGGGNPMDAFGGAEMNPMNTLDPANVQRFWGQMSPQQIQMLQVGWIKSQAEVLQRSMGGSYDSSFRIMFGSLAPQMGLEGGAGQADAFLAMSRNMPRLQREARAAELEQFRRSAQDEIDRGNDIWEGLGIRPGSRIARRALRPAWEGLADLADRAGDEFGTLSDTVLNRRMNIAAEGSLGAILARDPGALSAAAGASGTVVTKRDIEIARQRGQARWDGDARYEATRWEWLGRGTLPGALSGGPFTPDSMSSADVSANNRLYRDIRNAGSVRVDYSSAEDATLLKEADAYLHGFKDYHKFARGVREGDQEYAGSVMDRVEGFQRRMASQGKTVDADRAARVMADAMGDRGGANMARTLGSAGGSSQTLDLEGARAQAIAAMGGKSRSWLTYGITTIEQQWQKDALANASLPGVMEALANGTLYDGAKVTEGRLKSIFGEKFDTSLYFDRNGNPKKEAAAQLAQSAKAYQLTEQRVHALMPGMKGVEDTASKELRGTAVGKAVEKLAAGGGSQDLQAVDDAIRNFDSYRKFEGHEKGAAGELLGDISKAHSQYMQYQKMSGKQKEEFWSQFQEYKDPALAKQAAQANDAEALQRIRNATVLAPRGTSTSGSRSGNASQELAATEAAYRGGGPDRTFETMNQLYSAVSMLNEEIKTRKSGNG